MASEDEGDLGLVSLLGEGAVSDVGGKCTSESATSGLGDTTVVAAQAPITEAEVIASDGQIVAGSAVPSSMATGNTRLPDTYAQAPIGPIQGCAFSSGRGNEPMQLSSLHLTPVGAARIPTAQYHKMHLNISSRIFSALLWTAPELMAAQRAAAVGVSTGTQKGDVYSFAIILHEILYRAGLFRSVDSCKPILSKSKSL